MSENEYATLKLTQPMMHGPAVVRLQEIGDLLGFDTGPNDGIFGPATEQVVKALQAKLGLDADGICGPKTWGAILNAVNGEAPGIVNVINRASGFIDRRGKHPRPKLYEQERTWSLISGVTLHQTGCRMPQHTDGWDRLNAHIGVTQTGKAILVNDPSDFIWHAQWLSPSTIGVEIEGNYCGIDGDMRTLWKGGGGPDHLNSAMVDALGAVFTWLSEEFEGNGQVWCFVHAHRQSKNTRIADPGQEIWENVAIPWMKQLGVTDRGPDYKLGTGRPIPREWDIARTSRYWG